MAPFILKFKGNKSFVAFHNMNDGDSLTKTWKVCTKVAAHLEQGQRLENLSWRLWHLHNIMVESDNAKSKREFKKLSRTMGDKLDREKGKNIEELRAPGYKRTQSSDKMRRRAEEIERLRDGAQNGGGMRRMQFTFSLDTPTPTPAPTTTTTTRKSNGSTIPTKRSAATFKEPAPKISGVPPADTGNTQPNGTSENNANQEDDPMADMNQANNGTSLQGPVHPADPVSESPEVVSSPSLSPFQLPSSLRFPGLFSSGFGPTALLYPSPSLATQHSYGEDVTMTDITSGDGSMGVSRPTIELPLDELLEVEGDDPWERMLASIDAAQKRADEADATANANANANVEVVEAVATNDAHEPRNGDATPISNEAPDATTTTNVEGNNVDNNNHNGNASGVEQDDRPFDLEYEMQQLIDAEERYASLAPTSPVPPSPSAPHAMIGPTLIYGPHLPSPALPPPPPPPPSYNLYAMPPDNWGLQHASPRPPHMNGGASHGNTGHSARNPAGAGSHQQRPMVKSPMATALNPIALQKTPALAPASAQQNANGHHNGSGSTSGGGGGGRTLGATMTPMATTKAECSNCGATHTPLWRRGLNDELNCNACGLYCKLHKRPRPKSMRQHSDGQGKNLQRIMEVEVAGAQCFNCHTTATPLWRKDDEGKTVCNACGLYYKLHGTTRPLSLKSDVVRKRTSPGNTSRRASPARQASPTVEEERPQHQPTPAELQHHNQQQQQQYMYHRFDVSQAQDAYQSGMFYPGPYHPDYLYQGSSSNLSNNNGSNTSELHPIQTQLRGGDTSGDPAYEVTDERGTKRRRLSSSSSHSAGEQLPPLSSSTGSSSLKSLGSSPNYSTYALPYPYGFYGRAGGSSLGEMWKGGVEVHPPMVFPDSTTDAMLHPPMTLPEAFNNGSNNNTDNNNNGDDDDDNHANAFLHPPMIPPSMITEELNVTMSFAMHPPMAPSSSSGTSYWMTDGNIPPTLAPENLFGDQVMVAHHGAHGPDDAMDMFDSMVAMD